MGTPNSVISKTGLDRFVAAVEEDISSGLYHGAAIKIAHHGEVVLDLATGSAAGDGAHMIARDSVFTLLSTTKTIINVLVLQAIDRGLFSLTTKVVDIIPEFAGPPRDSATLFNLLTHTAGLPAAWEPKAGAYVDELADNVAAVLSSFQGQVEPGTRCDYSPVANHTLMAEILVRTDPGRRPFGQLVEEELFGPLGMTDTSFGIRPHMRDRHVVPDIRGVLPIKHLSRSTPGDHGLFEAESNSAAHVGAASTTGDLLRLAEALREPESRGDQAVISPALMKVARRNWTGEMPNELYKGVALRAGYRVPPAHFGLGFNVRGTGLLHNQFGLLTSPETFGNYGAGSTMYWVDPDRHLTFVALTAGLLPQARNIERFQRLSDLAVSAVR